MARNNPQRRAQRSSGNTPRWAILLVLLSTLLIATGQLLLKYGLENNLLAVAAGISLVGIAGVLVTMAFRHGELSALHALFGLGFLWATLASVLLLREQLSFTHMAGIGIIIAGVGLLAHSGGGK